MGNQKETCMAVFAVLLLGIIAITGCSDGWKSAGEQKAPARKQEALPPGPAEQEAFKKKIAELGVPVYKGATFVEVKRKATDSPLLSAVYELSPAHEKDYGDVKSFYSAGLKKALGSKGWTASQSADNVILYRKGFEIFYVELSRVIVSPDTNKIRIALHYGE
jgi:hypothetical protein